MSIAYNTHFTALLNLLSKAFYHFTMNAIRSLLPILFLVGFLVVVAIADNHNDSSSSTNNNTHQFVLTYESSSDLYEIETVVLEAGASVDRFLKCTRGIVISMTTSEEEEELVSSSMLEQALHQKNPNWKLMSYGEVALAHPQHDAAAAVSSSQQDSQ